MNLVADWLNQTPTTAKAYTFPHAHASGLWDAPDQAWTNRIAALKRVAPLVTLTETTRDTVVGRMQDGNWDLFRAPTYTDCTILWSRDYWDNSRDHMAMQLSSIVPHNANGVARPFKVQHVRLEKNGRGLHVFNTHAPSSNDAGLRLKVMRDGLPRLMTLVAQVRRDNPNAAILLTGDWNENKKRRPDIAYLEQQMSKQGCRSAWRMPYPANGTHGSALIDGDYYTGMTLVRTAHILPNSAPFDHKPFAATYRIG